MAAVVDHGDHDAVAHAVRSLLRGVQDGAHAFVVDCLADPDQCHGCHAPCTLSTAAQTAVSAVMNRTLLSVPPKVKFTAPGRRIVPSRCPSGLNTCTPSNEEA